MLAGCSSQCASNLGGHDWCVVMCEGYRPTGHPKIRPPLRAVGKQPKGVHPVVNGRSRKPALGMS